MNAPAFTGAPDASEIEEALDRLIVTPEFAASPRICEFLKFIVRETVAGRGPQIKAYSIALAVYERDETFDPQTSSIIRVEATRLRRLLDRYYSAEGARDEIVIALPRGSYTPVFTRRAITGPASQPEPPRPRFTPLRLALAACLAVAAGAAIYFFDAEQKARDTAATSQTPPRLEPHVIVQLQPASAAPEAAAQLEQLRTALENELGNSEHVASIQADAAQKSGPDYQIEIQAASNQTQAPGQVHLRVIHAPSGEIVWARSAAIDEPGKTARRFAGALTQPNGVLFADHRRRFTNTPPRERPFICIIAGYDFMLAPSSAAYRKAAECLQDITARHPEFQLAHAVLANVHATAYVLGFPNRTGDNALEAAIASAQRAFAIGGQSTRTSHAAFQIQFLEKRHELAFEAAESAIKAHPDAAILSGRIGAAHILRGNFAKGQSLIRQSLELNEGLGPHLAPYLFLAALMRGDERRAALWGMNRTSASSSPLTLIARILLSHSRGEIDNAERWSKRLQSQFPEFARDIKAGLDRMGMIDNIRDRLIAGLTQAGYFKIAPQAKQ